MQLALAHVTGTVHVHGDYLVALLGVLVVLAVGLAPALWRAARRSITL
jgi:hypothetical protein